MIKKLSRERVKHTYEVSMIYIATLLTVATLTSCDPGRTLVIKAPNKPNTSVVVYANANILPYATDNISEKIIIKIPEIDSSIKRDTTFYFGLGGWRDDSLMPSFSQNIDSIVIVNISGTVVLDNQTDINSYLLKNRRGFAKRKLIIEAK